MSAAKCHARANNLQLLLRQLDKEVVSYSIFYFISAFVVAPGPARVLLLMVSLAPAQYPSSSLLSLTSPSSVGRPRYSTSNVSLSVRLRQPLPLSPSYRPGYPSLQSQSSSIVTLAPAQVPAVAVLIVVHGPVKEPAIVFVHGPALASFATVALAV